MGASYQSPGKEYCVHSEIAENCSFCGQCAMADICGTCDDSNYCHAVEGCISYRQEGESCQTSTPPDRQYKCSSGFTCVNRSGILGANGICEKIERERRILVESVDELPWLVAALAFMLVSVVVAMAVLDYKKESSEDCKANEMEVKISEHATVTLV